ncbi:hypothetical protein CCR75_000667 [Bremia lactucae]|uniref:Uncharacterized protein n=1 Tax=Bremia lactucae TaxID=4779 RepID=A0A976IBI1_BRELC|nr:hypothetical protein CCR75_000667 [Bremia lactucae]
MVRLLVYKSTCSPPHHKLPLQFPTATHNLNSTHRRDLQCHLQPGNGLRGQSSSTKLDAIYTDKALDYGLVKLSINLSGEYGLVCKCVKWQLFCPSELTF